MSVEKYLKPSVINQIKRLDLRAQFVVKGFLHGLHASPFHGFSVEFSEHRKYTAGDDLKDIDWQVFAKTDKYYIKKFESETNITGYLLMDLSQSMGYTYEQELSKFDYAICLAAALAYLMISQQDPVGLVTFNDKVRQSLPPKSRRTQLGSLLSLLSNLEPSGTTNLLNSLTQVSALLKNRSLLMVFSDFLVDEEETLNALYRLKHGGHDVILFHILDEAEVSFPFRGINRQCDLRALLGNGKSRPPARRGATGTVPAPREAGRSRDRRTYLSSILRAGVLKNLAIVLPLIGTTTKFDLRPTQPNIVIS